MTKIAILQSNYIPWKGVFDLINQVDKFVFFDDVQFTKRDWRTRNKIKSPNGEIWLTVPVKKAPRGTKIYEIEISQEEDWQTKHYQSFKHSYSKTPYYDQYHYLLEEIYLKRKWKMLSEFNIFTTKLLCKALGVETEFYNSVELEVDGAKDDRLIQICQAVKGDFYISGPAAKDYIVNEKFKREGIRLAYINYEYPEYEQKFGSFNHFVTVLDVLFNCGEGSKKSIFQGNYEEVI